jgi:lipopolysaccharide export system permease protein
VARAGALSKHDETARHGRRAGGGERMNLLDRYVIRAMLGGVVVVLLVLLALGALFLFANQQDDIGVGTYTALDAFWFVLLNLPQQVYELMPISVLIGALLGLGTLARGSELTVMRAAGVSVWRIAGSVAMAALLLVVAAVICGELLAPPMQDMAKRQKALSKFANISFANRGGAWVRDGNLLINVSQQSGRAEFGGMHIYELTPDHQLASVATASTASVQPDGTWKLTRYAITRFGGETIEADHLASREFESAVGGDFLGLTVVEPRQLETRVLWQLVKHLQENNLDSRPQEFAFWSRIARTTAILFTALLAVPFVFGNLRNAGAGARLLIGVLIGVTFFFVQRTLESGAVVFDISPMALAWMPTGVLATAALVLIARTR